MAPFEDMSAVEKEEFAISLAVLICADAKVEVTVCVVYVSFMIRRRTLISIADTDDITQEVADRI